MTGSNDWSNRQAPSLADLDGLAALAWRRLPRQFRELCDNVVIRVEDFPSDAVLQEMGLDSPFDLLGLFQGVSIDRKSVMDPSGLPNLVHLYRRPILDYWAEHEETLGNLVAHVLVHEIGHHFGLSDADMEHIERTAAD
ncbi:MAG TPA: metallopeptidase family protein [Hyphomicrobiaceae bacterium]|nr:metallopeptidase family protein [Hyphomicrobiaceae bacterium]